MRPIKWVDLERISVQIYDALTPKVYELWAIVNKPMKSRATVIIDISHVI